MTTIAQVMAANPNWFSRDNKRFFGDLSYKVLHGKVSHTPFLVRKTNAWTDMFDGLKKPHFVVNAIEPGTLKVLSMVPGDVEHRRFKDIEEVKEFLATM